MLPKIKLKPVSFRRYRGEYEGTPFEVFEKFHPSGHSAGWHISQGQMPVSGIAAATRREAVGAFTMKLSGKI
jgi:hypothetical protein